MGLFFEFLTLFSDFIMMSRRSERLAKRRKIDYEEKVVSKEDIFEGIYRVSYLKTGMSHAFSDMHSFLTTDFETVKYYFTQLFQKRYSEVKGVHRQYVADSQSTSTNLAECTRAMVMNDCFGNQRILAEIEDVSDSEMLSLCLSAFEAECLSPNFGKVEMYGGPGVINAYGLGHFFRTDIIIVEKVSNVCQHSGEIG